MAKKIYIDKHDSISSIIERILNISERELIIYIPRFTESLSTINNLKLLKRETEAAGKKIYIESVDDKILKIAASLNMKATNPFFQKRSKPVSDILSPNTPIILDEDEDKAEADTFSEEEEKDWLKEKIKVRKEKRKMPKFTTPQITIKRPMFLVGISIFILGILGVAIFVLPRAHITLIFDKLNWEFEGSLLISPSIAKSEFSMNQLKVSGALFEDQDLLEKSYPATGVDTVERKAEGKLTIFNAYSSDSQPLVKNTRFVTPDGKIFRIYNDIVVPGAKIVDSKIVPSTIEVQVMADQTGTEYNIAKSKFRIPGFQGSPKYEGFYAESDMPMSGGFIGEVKIPTSEDIKNAKSNLRTELENSLRSAFLSNAPNDIKILDKAIQFSIVEEVVDDMVDEGGNFKISVTAKIKAVGFKEADLISVLREKLLSEAEGDESINNNSVLEGGNIDIELINRNIEYGEPRIDFIKGEMSLSVQFDSVWTRALNLTQFRENIRGESKKEVEELISSIPGLKARVSLWPIWVFSIPDKPSKIDIDVE
ncbi:MAG TPA: hypothetical protein VI432_00295 [Candidatus Paceibacterota bacterium]